MRKTTSRVVLTLIIAALAAPAVMAVAPTPEAVAKWKAEGVWEEKVAQWRTFKAHGGCAPNEESVFRPDRINRSQAAGTSADTVRVCVIMVQFTDNLFSAGPVGTPAAFDSILFSDSTVDTAGAIINSTGSMTDYYKEISYGQFYLKGDIFGPYTAPETYSYYVDGDNGIGLSDDLVRWLINTYDSEIDFSNYSRNGTTCDGLIIIHAGRGAEEAGTGIWSHKASIGSVLKDGVTISNYTMNPEEYGPDALCPIGVYCHEYGHFLGLPDLYDIQYTDGSNGAGMWSLMAYGNYAFGSKRPIHLDAWCRANAGFATVIDVPSTNLRQAAIPAVEANPVIYRLKNATTTDNEYWLVENRQKMGFDLNMFSEGLLIWHFDNGAPNIQGSNIYPPYRIALEQADGQYQLEYALDNGGDGGDPFPGATNNRTFHAYTLPASNLNSADSPQDGPTSGGIAVWNISGPDSIMYADLDVTYSRPYILFEPQVSNDGYEFNDDAPRGDGDGIPEAGETIHFYCWVKNHMRHSYNVRATLANAAEGITYTVPTVSFNTDLLVDAKTNASPIIFTVNDTITSVIDSFFLTITTDSLDGDTYGSEFNTVLGIEQQVGATQILIVDADGGEMYQAEYEDCLRAMRVPSRTWNKMVLGEPDAADLGGYSTVIWHTGDTSASAFFTVTEKDAMKGFLDGGGNLFLATLGIDDLQAVDSAFVADYFRVNYAGGEFWFTMLGLDGSPIGEGTQYQLMNLQIPNGYPIPYVNLLSGAIASFKSGKVGVNRIWGTSYSAGTFKTVWVTLPPELLNDGAVGFLKKDTLIARVVRYFGGQATDVNDGSGSPALPNSFTLEQNYPNPFNPTTTIQYTLHSTGDSFASTPATKLVIYNMLGQEVVTLVDKVQIPGTYRVEWDGADRTGHKVSSGVYLYRLVRGDDSRSMKMVLVK